MFLRSTDEFFGYHCTCDGMWLGNECQTAPNGASCAPGTLVPNRCSIDCAAVVTPFALECAVPLERVNPVLAQAVADFDLNECQTIGAEQFLNRIDILQIENGCELALAWQANSATAATIGVDPPETQPPAANADHTGGHLGAGFVEFEGPPSSQWIMFAVHVPVAGVYGFQVGYEPAAEDRPMQLSVDGAVIAAAAQPGLAFDGLVHFPAAAVGSASTYMLTGEVPITLQAGSNDITITTVGSSGASVDGMIFASGPPSSMSGNTATSAGGHRRQQTFDPAFRAGGGNFLNDMIQENPECSWDSIDEKVAAISDACCRADEPNMLCTDSLPNTCVWQCAVQVHAFIVKCEITLLYRFHFTETRRLYTVSNELAHISPGPEFVTMSGATYSNTQADFGAQLSLLHRSCLATIDVSEMQDTVNAAQCWPRVQQ